MDHTFCLAPTNSYAATVNCLHIQITSSRVLAMVLPIKHAVTHLQSRVDISSNLSMVNVMVVCGWNIIWYLEMAMLHHYIVFTIVMTSSMLRGMLIGIKQAVLYPQSWLDTNRNHSVVNAIVWSGWCIVWPLEIEWLLHQLVCTIVITSSMVLGMVLHIKQAIAHPQKADGMW